MQALKNRHFTKRRFMDGVVEQIRTVDLFLTKASGPSGQKSESS